MTAKHTPGPWIVTDQAPIAGLNLRGLKSVARKVGDTYHTVCEIVGGADAELIAQAPDLRAERDRLRAVNAQLLAALEYIATGGEDWKDCCRVARAAIAQAEQGAKDAGKDGAS